MAFIYCRDLENGVGLSILVNLPTEIKTGLFTKSLSEFRMTNMFKHMTGADEHYFGDVEIKSVKLSSLKENFNKMEDEIEQ